MARIRQRIFSAAALKTALLLVGIAGFFVLASFASDTVPTDVQIPGTQPVGTDNPPTISSVGNCGCHDFSSNRDAESHPVFGWGGGMMANAGRDPLFWATVAIAEQDFLPGDPNNPTSGGGVGDLCLHCHSVGGWLEGRSTPTSGAGLIDGTDDEGIMCHFCHQLVDPDQDVNVPSPPEGGYSEEQHGDFVAYDENSGDGYYGGAQYVLNGAGTRMGPYNTHVAKHDAFGTSFFREAAFCGTCHDVSNPAVGDLAHNHGAMIPFSGTASGVPGSPVAGKVAFNNEPHTYGIVERTFSEWKASAFEDLEVQELFNPNIPTDLQTAGGALDVAYQKSLWGNCSSTTDTYCNTAADCPGGETCVTTSVNYQDSTVREFTCQTCHMSATIGKGANNAKQGGNDYIRPDLPRHDQTGGSYWIQDAIKYQADQGTLRLGAGSMDEAAMTHAQGRARAQLDSAAALSAVQDGNFLVVRVTNLTGHKLITGYPEGRRMFLNIKWFNGGSTLIEENGAYGPIGNTVNGTNVESILDLASTKIYEAKPGMTRQWAQQLLALGYPSDMALEWDRHTNTVKHTLGELGNWPTPEGLHTFHFVLNNTMIRDNRIPPYRMEYDDARERNILPVPAGQYGNPGNGGEFDHWDEVKFPIPVGAASAEVRLYYQSTSWEYIQFLWLQSDGIEPFLGNEGAYMLDAWLHTGDHENPADPSKHMCPPHEMASVPALAVTAPAANPPGTASGVGGALMAVTGYNPSTGAISLSYTSACDATGHTIHYGNLDDVSTYGWGGADCTQDTSGSGSFIPAPAVGKSVFWIIAGHNGDWEGGYGSGSSGIPRPANTGSAGGCFRTQSVRNFCGS